MNTKIDDRARGRTCRPGPTRSPTSTAACSPAASDVPRFSRIARSYLLHVGSLDWTKINPDIFGSMIQAVADDEERGALGHALHQRAEHPEGAQPALPRRPAREAGGGGRQPPHAAEPAQAHGADPGLRPGLRLGQFPRHRLQGDAGDRGRDQPAPRRARPAQPTSRSPTSAASSCATSRPRSRAWRSSSPSTSATCSIAARRRRWPSSCRSMRENWITCGNACGSTG